MYKIIPVHKLLPCASFTYFTHIFKEPWIQHMTIRDNILFGKPYDEAKYQGVIYACALNEVLILILHVPPNSLHVFYLCKKYIKHI